jgi:hypothetical protein
MQAIISIKHALVQDAAIATLPREPRRALHARIAETLGSQFAEMAKNEPMLEAHSQIATYRGGRLRISWRSAPTIEVPISTNAYGGIRILRTVA